MTRCQFSNLAYTVGDPKPKLLPCFSVAALPLALLNKLVSEAQYGVGTESRLDEGREALVKLLEKQRKDAKVHAKVLRGERIKQLWIWIVALGFSYIDLVGTVFVAMEYWALGGNDGRHAARVTFGMLALSLLLQTSFSLATRQGAAGL